ncbi:MAG: transcriptional regulator, TrmB family [Firmicutes bacterium]|nr:transcriptional regulator, TrmB family [Bacillota bacterium]
MSPKFRKSLTVFSICLIVVIMITPTGGIMEQLLIEIQKIGFSQYESKAYIALLQHSPVTGYELSKRSGVPRSMIYEVINKLNDRGAIYIIPSDPIKYSPVPAQKFLARIRKNIDDTLNFLDTSLKDLEQVREVDVVSHINGYQLVMDEMLSIIDGATSELWLSVWNPQASVLVRNVQEAENRDVKVVSMVFGDKSCRLGATFHHDYMTADVVKERIGGKLTTLARDKEEAIIANFVNGEASWAVKTQDPALVLIATEFIRHDIMIEAITRHFGPAKLDELWRNNPILRYVVEGKQSD